LPARQAQGPQDHPRRLAREPRRRPAGSAASVPPAPLTSRPACGRCPWPPGSATRRAGPRACSAAKPSAGCSSGWASAGSGPSTGSSAPTPSTREKKVRDRLIAQAAVRPDWVLGFQDETWWTRLAQPDLFAWAGDEPLRLLPNERGGGPEALACYGLLRADTGAMLLRFVEGRPVSQVTEDYLGWLCGVFV